MKKVELIIRPDKLEKLKVILNECNVGGITVTSAMGCGNQKGNVDVSSYKGIEVVNMNLIPKIKAEVVVNDEEVEKLLGLIYENLSSGTVGDGKVFITTVDEAMRIRTGQRGKKVI
ncbi:MAG: P-II family nitrogen regulator [Roseburia sp.]|nr:P-II family nitrogen regulator [Roseburia sp.]